MESSEIIIAAITFATAIAPTIVVVARRRSIGPSTGAAWLVGWGAFIVAFEHGYFGIEGAVESVDGSPHARVHMLMAAVYGVLGAGALAVMGYTLLRRADPVGWFALLGFLIIGGGLELLFNGPVGIWFMHGLGDRSIPIGTFLYGYHVAWAAALALSYGTVFRGGGQSPSTTPRRV